MVPNRLGIPPDAGLLDRERIVARAGFNRWLVPPAALLAFGIILSMYGGGFATVPAYLADLFGTQFVGAIHGRLLTAWSVAGIFDPVVVS